MHARRDPRYVGLAQIRCRQLGKIAQRPHSVAGIGKVARLAGAGPLSAIRMAARHARLLGIVVVTRAMRLTEIVMIT
jgi:hypothetical protein